MSSLKQIFVQNGVIPATASDADAQAAMTYMQNTAPDKLQAMLAAGGYSAGGPPWLTIIGIGAGVVAVYLLWKNSQKRKPLDAFEYPEPDDVKPRLRGFSKSLSHFKGQRQLASCKPMGRARGYGAAPKKYEFEPEIRLEGYGRRARKTKSHGRAR